MDTQHEVVIIGGGLGGLLCGAILSREGLNVCVVERDKQLGGCLQTFAVQKKVFDACVHYIGGLGEGHSLHQIFRYVGILGGLRLESLNPSGFDIIRFGKEQQSFPIAQREYFIEGLLPHFPRERSALEKYLSLVDETAAAFPLYHLRQGSSSGKAPFAQLELWETLQKITADQKLQKVLAGNNLLYAGLPGSTPWYVHALVTHSYLHSAHKVLPGSSEIAKALAGVIRSHGGSIFRNTAVTSINESDGRIQSVSTANGNIEGAHFISAIHPAKTLELTDSKLIRNAYRKRITAHPQSPPSVMLNIILKPRTVRAKSHNIYWHPDGEVFGTISKPANTLAIFFSKDGAAPEYAESLSVLKYDDFSRYKRWENSSNRAGAILERPADYADYKEAISQAILEELYTLMPGLKENIGYYSMATPLTFRDYTASPEGSLYGLMKDVSLPESGNLSVRTRIPNLLLTGQNIGLHGVLGVSMTAIATCAEIIGMETLLGRITSA